MNINNLNWKTYMVKYVTANLLINLLTNKKPLSFDISSFNGNKVFDIYTEVTTGGAYNRRQQVCAMLSFGRAKAKVLMLNIDKLNNFENEPKDANGFLCLSNDNVSITLDEYQAAAVLHFERKIRLFIDNPCSPELAYGAN